MEVYKAINAVQSELATSGISKNRTASMGGRAMYQFRGIDDVYNVISPLLAKHKLCIIPRMISREVVERKTVKDSALFYVTLEAEFDFVSAVDGSKHTARTFGEAMDSGDKATNKAMSIAYKYACFQTFAIPTEEDNDPDATVQDPIKPKAPVKQAVKNEKSHAPTNNSLNAEDVIWAIQSCTDVNELQSLIPSCSAFQAGTPDYAKVKQAYSEKLNSLKVN